MKTRDEAARAFAEKMGLTMYGPSSATGTILFCPAPNTNHTIAMPAPDAPLPSMLEFVGRVALATFPNEDKVFHYGWVHGVLENCTEDARVKYDPCFAAPLAALAALES